MNTREEKTDLDEPKLSFQPGHELMNLVRVLRHFGATNKEIKEALLEGAKKGPLL